MPEDVKEAPPLAETAAPEEDERIDVTVRLKPFHHAYLEKRAAAHGETPARHLETILRTFKAHHDAFQPGRDTAPKAPGMPAGTRRA